MHYISTALLTIDAISEILNSNKKLILSEEAEKNIIACRAYLDKKVLTTHAPIYGINTGFGSLCDVIISPNDLEALQKNLVMSHACGTGEEIPAQIIKLMLLLKVQALAYGKSGVQLQTVERLIYFFNNDILPVIYQLGSLGASGDLSPLAHMSLPLIGLGEVYYKNEKKNSADVLKLLDLEPICLKSKEGLALLNGTQFMSAYGIWCILQTKQISKAADFISAVSLDAFDGRIEPFKLHLHTIRPHKGQLKTAENIRKIIEGSELIKCPKTHTQDPYSFRCIPQVHGASKDTFEYVENVFLTEINSVTDNPTIFIEKDEIISGGNFHGQPLALAFDFLAIALAELGNISERRTYQLISGLRGLPPFLVATPGLNSGLMILQYTAAGIVSQNKQLCTPASVDSIVSSNGQEDHVSMGANAAVKCYKVVENVQRILGIELLNASQALEFRRPLTSSPLIEKILFDYRKQISFIDTDVIMYPILEKSITFAKRITFF
ncbi:MAG: histidine ammonia-lyase [Bacteroidia bacterium]